MKYFENFPEVVYDGKRVKDITRRNQFVRGLQNNPLLYMPYTVEEGERAEDIANLVNFLSSDEATFITGCIIPVDGGARLKSQEHLMRINIKI